MRIPWEERSGILAGGNWIVDKVKIVDRYPERERLADVSSESVHLGGSPCNLLTDLARLGAPFPLAGVGLVGADADGERILAHCRASGIDATGILSLTGAATSTTDVMSEEGTGKRTFFHHRGANARLKSHHFDLERSPARIFHLGYLMLLDGLEALRKDGRTGAYGVLEQARSCGLKTSIDVVSSEAGDFTAVLAGTLPAVDILFLNEYEAEKTTGVPLQNAGPDSPAMRSALSGLLRMGVREWAVIHSPQGACALGADGSFHCQGSVCLPPPRIAGTVGAGDAFAAGVLYGIHEERGMEECLAYGACAAAACLTAPGSSEGILPLRQCLELGEGYGFRGETVGRKT